MYCTKNTVHALLEFLLVPVFLPDGVAEGATVVSKGQATLKDGVKVVVLN